MKNTRRGGPGGCAFLIWKRGFSGYRPGNGARRTFSVLPKQPRSEGKAVAWLGRSDCGTARGQGENGKIQPNKYNKKVTIFAQNKQKP